MNKIGAKQFEWHTIRAALPPIKSVAFEGAYEALKGTYIVITTEEILMNEVPEATNTGIRGYLRIIVGLFDNTASLVEMYNYYTGETTVLDNYDLYWTLFAKL